VNWREIGMGSILAVVDCGHEGASVLSSLQARIHMLYLLVFFWRKASLYLRYFISVLAMRVRTFYVAKIITHGESTLSKILQTFFDIVSFGIKRISNKPMIFRKSQDEKAHTKYRKRN